MRKNYKDKAREQRRRWRAFGREWGIPKRFDGLVRAVFVNREQTPRQKRNARYNPAPTRLKVQDEV